MLVIGMVGGFGGVGTWSAFSSTTESLDNDFAAGTVTISDNDNATSMFELTNMAPGGATEARCIRVTYTGSLPSDVALYGVTTEAVATDLDTYLKLKVIRGTDSSAALGDTACDTWTADTVDYDGAGPNAPGVIYDGTLAGFPEVGTPIADPDTQWTTNELRDYRFEVYLDSGTPSSEAGDSVDQSFTWRATNE